MVKKLRVGIVGCGAIGGSLARVIVSDFAGQAKLVSVYDIDKNKMLRLTGKLRVKPLASNSLDYLIEKADLIIEAADSKSSLGIAMKALNKGRDIIILSVGGIITHTEQLRNLARKKNARIYIPSGAICGIDALKGASQGKIKSVVLTTRKNPRSLEGIEYIRRKGIKLDKIKKDTLLFSGSARQAIKLFPRNINVAATLSIAGIGQSRTRVKIIASTTVKRNIHEICIESQIGRISSRVENLVHPDNPKTSFLAVLSAVATLKQILEPIRVGT